MIASQPLGWLPAERLTVPPGGGQLPIGAAAGWSPRRSATRTPTSSAPRPTRPAAVGRSGAAAWPCSGATAPTPSSSGRQAPLRLRHSEILTLLCANPEGLTSEELSVGVYGTPTRAAAIRVEISRLRKLLGDCVETEHYRLRGGVSSDVAQVCGLLHRGEVREAAARYPGPLLPGSTAPGVVASARRSRAGCASR